MVACSIQYIGKLKMKGQILYKGTKYTVCVFDKLLVVTNKEGKGKLIRKDHPQFNNWVECFSNVIDEIEMLSLIKGFLKC